MISSDAFTIYPSKRQPCKVYTIYYNVFPNWTLIFNKLLCNTIHKLNLIGKINFLIQLQCSTIFFFLYFWSTKSTIKKSFQRRIIKVNRCYSLISVLCCFFMSNWTKFFLSMICSTLQKFSCLKVFHFL